MTDPAKVAETLSVFEIERLVGWQGPPGAAYNCVSEDLCEARLLNADWSISPLGLAVREILLARGEGRG